MEMMTVRVLAFATAADQLGFRESTVEMHRGDTPAQLLGKLSPAFVIREGHRVAADHEYVDWHAPLDAVQELAIIPPVSGG